MDRFFWRKRLINNDGISYDKEGTKRESVKKIATNDEAVKVSNWIDQCSIELLKKIQNFMMAVGLIVVEGVVENSFLLKL